MDWNKKQCKKGENIRITKELMGCQTTLMNAAGWWRSLDRRWFHTSPFPFSSLASQISRTLWITKFNIVYVWMFTCHILYISIYTVVAKIKEAWRARYLIRKLYEMSTKSAWLIKFLKKKKFYLKKFRIFIIILTHWFYFPYRCCIPAYSIYL